jgi:hypothetical protein
MHPRWRLPTAVVLCALTASTCTPAPTAPPLAAAPAPAPAPAVTPSAAIVPAAPTPTPAPPPTPPAAPFDVVVTRLDADSASNAALLGVAAPGPDGDAVAAAAEGARQALQAYLTSQFADPATRLSASPVNRLLTPRAAALLAPAARPALGEIALPLVGTVTGPVDAEIDVTINGPNVLSVLVRYHAQLTVLLPDDRQAPLAQRGTMVFVPTPDGWRADVVDVTLDVPDLPLDLQPAVEATP